MARSLKSEVAPIYAMHRTWLADALERSDSLLTPGTQVWTVEHLDELEKDFIGQPDLRKDRNFLEKLHDQLARVSPGAVQLMAELHVVHFLIIWNGAISATKKLSDIEAILSWMPTPPAIPYGVAAAMAPGIVHPGQWMITRRDAQLAWLIRFARAWKDLPAEQRRQGADDPWRLKSFVAGLQSSAAEGSALALLHLAHPDAFEASVSPEHKRMMAERFADVAGSDDDIDRRLLAVREALTPEYGERFDWYADPLVHRWWKKKDWGAFLRWLRRFGGEPTFDDDERNYKLELAGKVRDAQASIAQQSDGWLELLRHAFHAPANNLTQWQAHDKFLRWVEGDPATGRAALQILWGTGERPAERLQLFLERVPTTALGPIGERLNIGSFLLMAQNPTFLPPVKVALFRNAWKLTKWGREPDGSVAAEVYERVLIFLDEIVRDSQSWDAPLRDRLDAQGAVWAVVKSNENRLGWPQDEWDEFLAWRASAQLEDDPEDLSLVEPEPPTETDEVTLVDHIAQAARDLHLDRRVLDEIVDLLDDKRQVVLYGPPGTGKTYLAIRLAKAIAEGDATRVSVVQFHPATSYEDFFEGLRPTVTDAGQVTYERTDGPLVAIAKAAASDPDRRYIMVIDEINRANLPKVFGELLFLLEYRTESAHTLYRPTEQFRIPNNLWFIGTMNTADRSVALVDAAMRRRFHFVPFFPHDGAMKGLLLRWLEDAGGRLGVAAMLDAVNAELLDVVGEHLLIGPSHFMKTDLSDRALERIWTYNVFPLIEEQLWGNRDQIDRWRWAAVRQRFGPALVGSATGEPKSGDDDRSAEHADDPD